jgi:hypothetical protein
MHDLLALLEVILVAVVNLFDNFIVAPRPLLDLVQVVSIDLLLTLKFFGSGRDFDCFLFS